jgi:hypothetical protein
MNLEGGGVRELIRGQLRTALVEVVSDPHRPDGVRARRSRPDLVELLEGGHDWPLGFLHDFQLGRDLRGRDRRRLRRRGGRSLFRRRRRTACENRHRPDHGAAHQERAAVEAVGDLELVQLEARRKRVLVIGLETHLDLLAQAWGQKRAAQEQQGAFSRPYPGEPARIGTVQGNFGDSAPERAGPGRSGSPSGRSHSGLLEPWTKGRNSLVRPGAGGPAAAAACRRRSCRPKDWLESITSRGWRRPGGA